MGSKEIRLPALHPRFRPRLEAEGRRPGHPGTAVRIGEDLFEVVSPVPKVWWERALEFYGRYRPQPYVLLSIGFNFLVALAIMGSGL